MFQGLHSTGKSRENGEGGGWRSSVRENTGNLEICQDAGKTQGILIAQFVNLLILKIDNIAIFAAFFPFKLNVPVKSVTYK